MFVFSCIFILFTAGRSVNADCNVVTRKEWDGVSPIHVEYLARPVDLVVIQHTGTETCSDDSDCAEIVRNIQTNHMDNMDFWDIGSSFVVGGNGKVYEGPGWIHVGAHTYGYNRKSIAISFIGNFNKNQPTTAAMNAAQALIKCGVDNGHLKEAYHLVAHKQLIATESPGRKLYNEMRRWPNWLENVSSIKNKTN